MGALVKRPASGLRRRLQKGARRRHIVQDSSGQVGVLLDLPSAGPTDLGAVSARGLQTAERKEHFAGVQCAILEVIAIAEAAGARRSTILAALSGAHLLREASEGNYSNTMWPASQGRGRRRPSFDISQALGMILGLVKLRIKIDTCEPAIACLRVAAELDQQLKPHKISLSGWAPAYVSHAHRGSGKKVKRKAPIGADHPMAGRLLDWYSKGAPGFNDAEACGHATLRSCEELMEDLSVNTEPSTRRLALEKLFSASLLTATEMIRRSYSPKVECDES